MRRGLLICSLLIAIASYSQNKPGLKCWYNQLLGKTWENVLPIGKALFNIASLGGLSCFVAEQNAYPNYLKKRIFNVVFVIDGNGEGITDAVIKKAVVYVGNSMILKTR